MIESSLASSVLRRARTGGADFAEIYLERWRRRSMRCIDGDVAEASSGIELGAGIRLLFGTDVAYAYTNDLSPASLESVVADLLRLKGEAGVDARGGGGLDFRRASAAGLHAPARAFDAEPKRQRLAWIREMDDAARVDPAIAKVEASILEWEQDVTVVNSDGLWVDDRRVRTRALTRAIAQDDSGATQTGIAAPGLSMGLEFFDRNPPAEIGREAGRQALVKLRADEAPAGTFPVVIGNGFGGVIFHEALGHLLETTSVAKGASVLAGKHGQTVASPTVTYIDDGTIAHGWGSSEYDDEGAATERTVLIENGVLRSYMVDRLGALKTGYHATGSGRRQDYTFAPTSRMRNTFIAPGDTPIGDLFTGISTGLYAKKLGGGQVRPGSGEYNFAVQEGYMIRNGEIAEPVRGAMLVGKGPDSIRRIAAVASDLATEPGMCGSLSGSIPVELGQPHLLVDEIVVGGAS